MDNRKNIPWKTEPFLSPPGSEIYLCQAIRDLAETLINNMHLGAGLQLVTGPAGSGKSTLLELLEDKVRADSNGVVLMLRNPVFKDLQQFLITVAGTLRNINAPAGFDDNTLQSAFNSFFFKLYQQEKKIVVLLIDNGRDLPDFCLQALQSFYDYHPDCRHFLQAVICDEPSLQEKINAAGIAGNHVSWTASPGPFNFLDVRKFISFHLDHAASQSDSSQVFFSMPAQWAIYRLTQGQPQQIIDLCRYLALSVVIENRQKVDWFMTLLSARLLVPGRAAKLQIIRASFLASLIIFNLGLGLWSVGNRTAEIPTIENLSRQTILPDPIGPPKKLTPGQTGDASPLIASARIETSTPVKAAEKKAAEKAEQQHTAAEQIPGAALTVDTEALPGAEKAPATEEILPPASDAPAPPPKEETTQKLQSAQKPMRPMRSMDPPAHLGDIITAPGENFGDMVRRIYGPWSFNSTNIKTVLAANPNLQNPEMLHVGDKVRFPAIPVALTPMAENVWWARLNTFGSIENAYRFLRQFRKQPASLLIIPGRDESGRIFMNVLLEKYFTDKETAEKTVQALPASMASQAEILHGLSRETFYYRIMEQE